MLTLCSWQPGLIASFSWLLALCCPLACCLGVEQQAPDVHWAEVALRMHFSRQQKLHFRLAIQVGVHDSTA
jgi:hypothetical protein